MTLSGIGSQPTRLSDFLNLKILEVSNWFFAFTEATKNVMLFWVMPQNNLGQSVCRIFYFWLVWLVNLNTWGPMLHCTCFFCIQSLISKLSLFPLFFIFSPNDNPSKTMTNLSSKKPFHFRDIQIFVIFSLPFHTLQIQKGNWKWNNL